MAQVLEHECFNNKNTPSFKKVTVVGLDKGNILIPKLLVSQLAIFTEGVWGIGVDFLQDIPECLNPPS